MAARPGFSFLICPDSGLLKEELNSLVQKSGAQETKWERAVFWGDEEAGPRFWQSLSQQNLFASPRIVIVRNAQAWPAATWERISGILAKGTDSVWPIFCLEVGLEKGKFKIPAYIQKLACFKYAEKSRWIVTRPPLASSSLEKFVSKEGGVLGLKWENGALASFCSSVPPDALLIKNELARLSMAAADRTITREMISNNLGNVESNAFIVTRNLLAGDLAGAWREATNSPASSLLFFLLALLERELRLMWGILAGNQVRLHPSEAPKKRELARLLGYNGISAGFCALSDAEWQVKSGSHSPEQALEWLLTRMSGLFRQQQ